MIIDYAQKNTQSAKHQITRTAVGTIAGIFKTIYLWVST